LLPSEERVILVDPDDAAVGSAEKLAAHRDGALHRACSVFVFNDAGALLVQRRAAGKYHSPGLWSNSCCGHPRPGEETLAAARRRLREEMGIECELHAATAMMYTAPLEAGLIEHEFDHIFVGRSDGVPSLDRAEADAYEWRGLAALVAEMREHPERFTAWFGAALRALIESDCADVPVSTSERAELRRMAREICSPLVTVIAR
jgi:isopentenyl-diphosphate delta-isomerase